MKKFREISKNGLILFGLLLATLFLLELPRMYYRETDEKLLEERGTSQYETQTIKNMDAFMKKVDAFRNYNESSALGYIQKYDYEKVTEESELLLQELKKLSESLYKSVSEQKANSGLEGMGFEAQVIRFSKQGTDEAQAVWKIGLIEWMLEKIDGNIRILYDTSTYKIFSVEWGYADAKGMLKCEDLDKQTLQKYYEGIPMDEPTIVREFEHGFISVLSIEDLDKSGLFAEMYDLTDYYRGNVVAEETE